MQPIQSIAISQPCHENWNQMTSVDQGRHCDSCSKTVIDFTVMSNNEVINYFAKHGNLCGRFSEQQLVGLNNYLVIDEKPHFSWKKLALAAAVTSLFTTVKAQTTVTIGRVAVSQFVSTDRNITLPNSIAYRVVKGKIIADDDNSILPGVSIRIKGTNQGTVTNAAGEFILRVPTTSETLSISFIGYQNYEANIASLTNQSNCISLRMQSQVLGGAIVIVRKVPFYKVWWYKLKRVF
ncbi:carboxypeptidase-like regulatory domain-containing protein [Mucilaginibacter sp. RB4R14]|uniref:carboxypeptidase-like regulatory domain-containing protein n=1 Tax=Mucilaginibacter aurantiaciroseus TaxID=2949308 RepID=UPI002091CE05|nr:carboxypeptidase-like regulatory domain-containing protein [Mucilaginibacter aurantiaciroseus]MCO5934472.1 carboxypeptidase-like regulatory domain-containing protein [Mucilaginibacter aurantiaciroseus]